MYIYMYIWTPTKGRTGLLIPICTPPFRVLWFSVIFFFAVGVWWKPSILVNKVGVGVSMFWWPLLASTPPPPRG